MGPIEPPALWARVLPTCLALGHVTALAVSGTLRIEHAFFNLLLGGFPWLGPRLARFALLAIPVWMAGVLMDAQRHWLHLRGAIHTGDLFLLERSIFPFGGTSLSEWLVAQVSAPMDLLCGAAYATYIVEVFIAAIVLFYKRSPQVWVLAWAFFGINLLGAISYMVYPAAPPWYVAMHGMGPADPLAAASAAGAARFDALIGMGFFEGFYSRNPNVFGAMPSLHTAYPVVALWQVWHLGKRWRVGAGLFAGLIGFSAVYLQHHYILDVAGGVAAALLACVAVDAMAASLKARGTAAVRVDVLAPEGETRV